MQGTTHDSNVLNSITEEIKPLMVWGTRSARRVVDYS